MFAKPDPLIEDLRSVAHWLETHAAHRPNAEEYTQIRRLATTCRRAADRLEALRAKGRKDAR